MPIFELLFLISVRGHVVRTNWTALFSDRQERWLAILTVAVMALTLTSYTGFLASVEARSGVRFTDPLHGLIGPVDLTWVIFLILYGALILAIAVLLREPVVFFRALRAYTMLIGIRMICMWLLPLDPPESMIILNDPFVEMFTTGGSATLTRDLFFSGHTSTLCLIGFVTPGKWYRAAFFSMAVIVGIAVIAQHVHYSVDVAVAPLAAFAAARLAGAGPRR